MYATAERWFTPPVALVEANKRLRSLDTLTSAAKQSFQELRSAALFALGFAKLFGTPTLLSPVPIKEQIPDIKMRRMYTGRNHFSNTTNIEVVSYTSHSKEELIDDFLWRTKLNPRRKQYPADTVILCHVEPVMYVYYDYLAHSLSNFPYIPYSVFLLCNQEERHQYYSLRLVYPELGPVVEINSTWDALHYFRDT